MRFWVVFALVFVSNCVSVDPGRESKSDASLNSNEIAFNYWKNNAGKGFFNSYEPMMTKGLYFPREIDKKPFNTIAYSLVRFFEHYEIVSSSGTYKGHHHTGAYSFEDYDEDRKLTDSDVKEIRHLCSVLLALSGETESDDRSFSNVISAGMTAKDAMIALSGKLPRDENFQSVLGFSSCFVDWFVLESFIEFMLKEGQTANLAQFRVRIEKNDRTGVIEFSHRVRANIYATRTSSDGTDKKAFLSMVGFSQVVRVPSPFNLFASKLSISEITMAGRFSVEAKQHILSLARPIAKCKKDYSSSNLVSYKCKDLAEIDWPDKVEEASLNSFDLMTTKGLFLPEEIETKPFDTGPYSLVKFFEHYEVVSASGKYSGDKVGIVHPGYDEERKLSESDAKRIVHLYKVLYELSGETLEGDLAFLDDITADMTEKMAMIALSYMFPLGTKFQDILGFSSCFVDWFVMESFANVMLEDGQVARLTGLKVKIQKSDKNEIEFSHYAKISIFANKEGTNVLSSFDFKQLIKFWTTVRKHSKVIIEELKFEGNFPYEAQRQILLSARAIAHCDRV